MKKLRISGKEMRRIGFQSELLISQVKKIIYKHYNKTPKVEILSLLENIIQNPEDYKNHEHFSKLAEQLIQTPKQKKQEIKIYSSPLPYKIYGKEGIDEGSLKQMDVALQLPITVKGALMADAHQGYGLPIGGVLATDNAVIPYGVGMDIGCRMCLSVYPFDNTYIKQNRKQLLHIIQDSAHFGRKAPSYSHNDKILEDKAFKEISFLKSLKSKAAEQLGTSGSGNHFADIGIIEVKKEIEEKGLKPGDYLAILTHSGSRGMGAE